MHDSVQEEFRRFQQGHDDLMELWSGDSADDKVARIILEATHAVTHQTAENIDDLSGPMLAVSQAMILSMGRMITFLKSMAEVKDPEKYRVFQERQRARREKEETSAMTAVDSATVRDLSLGNAVRFHYEGHMDNSFASFNGCVGELTKFSETEPYAKVEPRTKAQVAIWPVTESYAWLPIEGLFALEPEPRRSMREPTPEEGGTVPSGPDYDTREQEARQASAYVEDTGAGNGAPAPDPDVVGRTTDHD